MHDKIVSLDPPADRTAGDMETFRDLGDSEELELIVAVTATTDMAESSRFRIVVAGALSSRGHAAPASRGE